MGVGLWQRHPRLLLAAPLVGVVRLLVASYSNYRLPVAEARLLASMESVKQDLLGVIEYCDRLEALDSNRPDFFLWDALCSGAVVRYARCFSSGARHQLRHDLFDGATQEHRELHDYLIAVRSKHVAHSVNWFEETEVTAMIREDDNSIHSVAAGHGRVVGLDSDMPGHIRHLVQWLLSHVEEVIAQERPKLLAVAQALGADKIKSFGSLTFGGGTSNFHPSRSRNKP